MLCPAHHQFDRLEGKLRLPSVCDDILRALPPGIEPDRRGLGQVGTYLIDVSHLRGSCLQALHGYHHEMILHLDVVVVAWAHRLIQQIGQARYARVRDHSRAQRLAVECDDCCPPLAGHLGTEHEGVGERNGREPAYPAEARLPHTVLLRSPNGRQRAPSRRQRQAESDLH